jgi:1,4-dihydroxy-2-naphthoate octaprenyltransferase
MTLIPLVALVLVLANLALGRPDDLPDDATLAERLAARVRPKRLAWTVAVALVLVAGGAVTLAKGAHWLILALALGAATRHAATRRPALAYA